MEKIWNPNTFSSIKGKKKTKIRKKVKKQTNITNINNQKGADNSSQLAPNEIDNMIKFQPQAVRFLFIILNSRSINIYI